MSTNPATTLEPIKVAADSLEPGDVLRDLGRYHEVAKITVDPGRGLVEIHFLRICSRWFHADAELTILPGPSRCALCQKVYDDTAERPEMPTADGRVHASCLVASNPVATARLRAAVDAGHEALFNVTDPGKGSWARPVVTSEGSAQ